MGRRAYWELVVADINAALAVLRPVFDTAGGSDGFVSVEVAPELARDTHATIAAARSLRQRINQPNQSNGIAGFHDSFQEMRAVLDTKAHQLNGH